MSSTLDNLTTSIVMVMMMRKIVPNYKERWVYGSMIIIAANSGGAWSPIGDVTTIMLWIKGKITTWPVIAKLFLPGLVSMVIPLLFARRMLKGTITESRPKVAEGHITTILSERERIIPDNYRVCRHPVAEDISYDVRQVFRCDVLFFITQLNDPCSNLHHIIRFKG